MRSVEINNRTSMYLEVKVNVSFKRTEIRSGISKSIPIDEKGEIDTITVDIV